MIVAILALLRRMSPLCLIAVCPRRALHAIHKHNKHFYIHLHNEGCSLPRSVAAGLAAMLLCTGQRFLD